MSIPKSRLLDLMKVQCRVFNTTYNPQGLRTGNKILRQRLKGPSLVTYYPPRMQTLKELTKAFGTQLNSWDDKEEERLEHLTIVKARGKGAPKKKRTIEESKKFKGKKK